MTSTATSVTTASTMTGTGTTSNQRARPNARKAAGNVPVVSVPSGRIVPVASDGMEADKPTKLTVGALEDVSLGAGGIIERVFLTGVPHIVEGLFAEADVDLPAACLPMKVDDRTIGVIVIHTILAQKDRFVAVDFELFKMLGVHAGAALVGAQLFAEADGKLPSLDLFIRLDAHTSAPPRRES